MKKIFTGILAIAVILGVVNLRTINVKGEDHFGTMRYRWRENLVGNLEDKGDLKDNEYIIDYIKALDDKAQIAYDDMNTENDRISLWTRNSSETKSAYLTRNFQNLATITKSYGMQGSVFYDDPAILNVITEGLEFLVDVEKYDGKGYYGNWWDWQIGIPVEFLSMLFILESELDTEVLDKYINVLELYLPDPYKQIYSNVGGEVFKPIVYTSSKTSGANRADLAHSVLGIGILKGDTDTIKEALESVPEVFDIVTKGEGFYEDGMFLFHTDTPYIGSYGVSLFKSVASMLSIVVDTPYDMDENVKQTFIKLVNDSTLPFINKGKFVGMVEGRAVSRPSNHTENARGSSIVKTLSLASQSGNDPYSVNMFKAVKYWVSEDPDFYISLTANYEELISIINVIESDVSLDGFVPFDGAKVFPTGDRFVYSDINSYIGISMYSSRISAYTVGNNENLKGWHLSDGFVYMMNDDKQFGKSYWPTVDMYRLPGTTVDTRPLADATDAWTSYNSKSDWAGGTNSGHNASVSMLLDKNGYKNNGKDVGMDLLAKKSWFMIDGHLVSVGSGISGTTTNSIEQVIENKLLDKEFNYELKGENGPVNVGELNLSSGDYLLLQANNEKNNIGYAFLNDTKLDYQLDHRVGKYNSINGGVSASAESYEETYLKLIQNYGNNVSNGRYAYVQVQGADENDVKASAERFEILEQSSDVHAVYDHNTKTTAATIWNKDGGEVGNVKSNKGISLLVEDSSLYTDFYVSEPTQKEDEIILTITDLEQQEIILGSNVKQISDTEFSINVKGTTGNTSHIRFIKPVDKVELEDIYSELVDFETKDLTPYSKLTVTKLLKKSLGVLENTSASFEEVEEMKNEIVSGLADLDLRLDLTPVERLISKIKNYDASVFTEDSWAELVTSKTVLEELKRSYDQFKPLTITSDEVEEAYKNALRAINGLSYKRDTLNFKKYDQAIDAFKAVEESKKTVLSYGVLNIKVAQSVKDLKKLDITQSDIDTYVSEITELQKKLEDK